MRLYGLIGYVMTGLALMHGGLVFGEGHADEVVSRVLELQRSIEEEAGADHCIFLSFWDFDGTILKGDCSEGLKEGDDCVYKGMAQLCIEAGFAANYDRKDGFEDFWEDYRYMEHRAGKWVAYPYIGQMLRGASEESVLDLGHRQFEEVYSRYYFSSSIKMMRALEAAGVQNYVISASADVFVDAAAPSLGLPLERFHGIEVQVENGRLTEQLVYPVTWAEGKTQKLMELVSGIQRRNPDKQVFVLAAFGNSYGTDGPFLRYVAKQCLPQGRGISVMINGGEAPEAYRGLFWCVDQDAGVSGQ